MIDTEEIRSELKKFARMTGGEYSDHQEAKYLAVEVEYSNGLITLHLAEGASIPLVLLSTNAEMADGSILRGTIGFSEPDEYFDVHPEDKDIMIGSSTPSLYVIFEADNGRVKSINLTTIRRDIDRVVHRVGIGWSPPTAL